MGKKKLLKKQSAYGQGVFPEKKPRKRASSRKGHNAPVRSLRARGGLTRNPFNQVHQDRTRYQEMVENANCIILDMDTMGNLTFINRYGREFFGFSGDELLGKNVIGTIVPPVDSAGTDLRDMMSNIYRMPDRYFSSENENMRKGGERVWIAWTNRGIYGKEKKLEGVHSFGIAGDDK